MESGIPRAVASVALPRIGRWVGKPSQELIVLFVTVVIAVIFAVGLPGFASLGNLLVLARNVSVLGILALGLGIVVIARGLDLSMVATMLASSGMAIELMNANVPTGTALAAGFAVALVIGALNGYIIAFVEVPALLTTLATTFLISGATRHFMGKIDAYPPTTATDFLYIGQGTPFGAPMPVIIFIVLALAVAWLLSRTSFGRFIYAHGDNSDAARLTGVTVRSLTVMEYVLSAAIAFVAGTVMSAEAASLNLYYVDTTAIFDVILVVVLGGVSLVGGRGSVFSLLVGTALIGTLLNGLTILNFDNQTQDIIKGFVLFAAIIIDNRLHPRDEETARQGD